MDKKKLIKIQSIGKTESNRGSVGGKLSRKELVGNTNYKEDALIEAIDRKKYIERYADLIEKLRIGQLDPSQFLQNAAPDVAIQLLYAAVGGDIGKNQLAAIQDVLDRTGYGKVQKHAIANIDPSVPKEQLYSMILGLAKKTKAVEIEDDEDQKE